MSTMKKISRIDLAPPRHWVGDGFHVHGMFSYNANAADYSPFLMLDYGAPYAYAPNSGKPRGVGAHPHRGFETVTIAYAGAITHRDSAGGGGVIDVGDVQWMTAGAGIIHDEFHSPAFSAAGGEMHMVQLWVNLPAKDKMTPPKYQAISHADIAEVAVGKDGQSALRLIAGNLDATNGAAKVTNGAASTFTPMCLWDVQIAAGDTVNLPQPEGWTCLVLVQQGSVQVNESAPVGASQLVVMQREGTGLALSAAVASRVLMMSGEPINEPVVGYGPFVMNTQAEIRQAVTDYNSGKFGKIG